MKNLYIAKASSQGGRAGHVETNDKRLVFDLTPFTATTGTNPEQLFACGYAACFGSALEVVAKKANLNPGQITVNIEVAINEDDQSGFFLAVKLDASLPGLTEDEARQIILKAHKVCPYSKATRGNIEVKLHIDGKEVTEEAQTTG